jgi:hypothetical protein
LTETTRIHSPSSQRYRNNAIRADLAEFGIVAAVGRNGVEPTPVCRRAVYELAVQLIEWHSISASKVIDARSSVPGAGALDFGEMLVNPLLRIL